MTRHHKEAGYVGFIVLFILLLNVTLGGVATEYFIESWAGFIKGVPVDVPFWPCVLAGLFLGEFTIPAAVVTFILIPFL